MERLEGASMSFNFCSATTRELVGPRAKTQLHCMHFWIISKDLGVQAPFGVLLGKSKRPKIAIVMALVSVTTVLVLTC